MAVLRWLRNKLEIDTLYFARGAFWVTVENLLSTSVGLVFGILLANLLSKEEYGTYQYIFSLFGTLQIFLFNGMNMALVQAVAAGEEGAFRKIVDFRLRWGFLFSIAAIIVAAYYFYEKNYTIALSLIIIGLLIPLNAAFGSYQSFLQGKKEFRLASLYSLVSQLTSTAVMIASLIATKNLIILFFAYASANTIVNFFLFQIIKRKFPVKNEGGNSSLIYGRKLTVLEIISVLAKNLDKLVLFQSWGPAVLAQYAITQIFPGYGYSFLKSLSAIFMPKLADKSFKKIAGVFYKKLFQLFLIGFAMAIIYIFSVPFLFALIYPKYSQMVWYSQILSINMALALPNGLIGSIFTAKKLIKSLYRSQIASDLTRIVLYLIFGIIGGLTGMIAAFIVSQIIGTLFNLYLWEREKNSFLRKLNDSRAL